MNVIIVAEQKINMYEHEVHKLICFILWQMQI